MAGKPLNRMDLRRQHDAAEQAAGEYGVPILCSVSAHERG